MAKVTTVTTSYTSNIVVDGTAISADKIYADGTQVRRCIVNGKDVIHKFTRTVVTASSNLTLTFTVRFTVDFVGIGMLYFKGPISVDVAVTDNGSSGFTSITLVTPLLTFYCEVGTQVVDSKNCYQQQLTNQSLPIGQTTTLTFSYFDGQYIGVNLDAQYTGYDLLVLIDDPDGIETAPYILKDEYTWKDSYYHRHIIQREVDNKIVSDSSVQEY